MPTDDIQIQVAGTAPVPLDYRIPGNGQLRPKAINATYDGSGAAGAFLPTIEIVSDGGVVVARCPASSVAAGASAEVSWFPGVAAQTAAAAASANLSWGIAQAQAITIGSGGGFTNVNFDTTLIGRHFGSSGDGVVTIGAVGGGVKGMILNTQGVYRVSWHVQGFLNVAPAATSTIELGCDFDTGDYIAGHVQDGFTLTSAGPQRIFECGLDLMLDLDPANYPIPNTGKLEVRQNSGQNVTCYFIMTAMLCSTVTDPGIL